MKALVVLSAVGMALGMGAGVWAGPIEVIYSRASGSPTSDVPGAVDAGGAPMSVKFRQMLEFWLSPDGTKWMLRAASVTPADLDQYLIIGSGLTGTSVMQEGRPFPGAVGTEVVDFFSSSVGYPFDSNNNWALSLRARGGTTSVANKIVRFNGATGVLRFQQGGAYTGMMDIATQTSGDETIGNSTASIHLLDDGRIGWRDAQPGNLSSFRYPPTAYDAVKHLQKFVDSVTTLDGTGTVAISDIGSTGTISVFLTSPDGVRTVVRGKVDADGNGATIPTDPDVVMVDGRVRVQLSQLIPGTTITPTAINQTFVAANHDWYVRGTVSEGSPAVVVQGWAMKNGTVIAKTGDSIGSDAWGTTFYAIAGNTNGDWVIPGRSNNADLGRDDVLVVNGQVVLREGDPVSLDLDGNGTMETVYIGRANNTLAAFVANNGVGIAPDGTVYVLAFLKDVDSLDVAPSESPYALLRIAPTNPCPADFNNSGAVTVQDIFDFLAAYFSNSPSADFNHVGGVTVQDIFDFLAAYFTGCT